MEMLVDVLYDMLNERLTLSRHGHKMENQIVSLPVFYLPDSKLLAGSTYVLRTQDLPRQPHCECLYICTGSRPIFMQNNWLGEIFYVEDQNLDILTVFNNVQQIFNRLSHWNFQMQELLDSNANIEEMVRISIPIFENRITVTNYNLEVLAFSEAVEVNGRKEMQISRRYTRVPDEKGINFKQTYQKHLRQKKPYIYKDASGVDQYCINLYLGDTCVGYCSLCQEIRPLRESDFQLFQIFASMVRRTLSSQMSMPDGRFITLKTILSDLLQCFPVRQSELNHCMNSQRRNMESSNMEPGNWICLVIQSANRSKTLPERYLCTSLENLLPHCTAIAHDGLLAAYCLLQNTENPQDSIYRVLEPYLRDMNFRAGVSDVFDDMFKARSYYLQALAILKAGCVKDPAQFIYPFEDYILYYIIQHSRGEFDLNLILPHGLQELKQLPSDVDYWETLKQYLNFECNASQTAKEMFLHRSTLLLRLKKIKNYVKLDTPKQRLYIRMCMEIYDQMMN